MHHHQHPMLCKHTALSFKKLLPFRGQRRSLDRQGQSSAFREASRRQGLTGLTSTDQNRSIQKDERIRAIRIAVSQNSIMKQSRASFRQELLTVSLAMCLQGDLGGCRLTRCDTNSTDAQVAFRLLKINAA